MHDVGMHDVGMHYMGVHDVAMPGMAMPSMDVYKKWTFSSGKKLIFDAHLGENANFFFLLYVAELILQTKRWSLVKIMKTTLPTHT